jgi:hypothetical protein
VGVSVWGRSALCYKIGTMETANDKSVVRRRRPWWKIVLVVIGLLLVGVVSVFIGLVLVGDVDVPTRPVTAKRGDDGVFVSDRTPETRLMFQSTRLEANSSTSSTGTSSSSNSARLFAKSIAVFAESDSVMDRRVAYQLFLDLQNSKQFDSVVFYPAGNSLMGERTLPDLTAHVRTERFDASGNPMNQTFDVRVLVRLQSHGVGGRSFYSDHLSPPAISLNYQYTVECKAQQKGIESAGERYGALARNIAGSVAGGIEKFIDDSKQKQGEPGAVAPEFFPAYTPTPELAFVKAFNGKAMVSGTQFMRANVSTWEVRDIAPGRDIVEEATSELKGKGWVIHSLGESGPKKRLRASTKDDSEVVEIQWRATEGRPSGGPPPENVCEVSYQRRMSVAEIQKALRALLARDPSEADLASYSAFWHFEQRLFEAYFEKNPPQTVKGVLHLARGEISRKNLEKARKLLLRADVLGRIASAGGGTPSEVSSLGESAGLKTFPEQPDITALLAQEVVDVSKDLPAKRRVKLGRSVFVVWKKSQWELYVVRVTPVATGNAARFYTFEVVEDSFRKGSTSMGVGQRGDPTGKSGPLTLSYWTKEGKGFVIESKMVGEEFELEFKESEGER